MQISAVEIAKLLTSDEARLRRPGEAPLEFKEIAPDDLPESKLAEPDATEVARLVQMVKQMPDVREDIVMQLKERIENGEYEINGDEITEMMTRRMKADRIR